MATLKIGDVVEWRGCYGSGIPKLTCVTFIERTESPDQKEGGTPVRSIDWAEDFVVDLDNGHWAYKRQLTPPEEVQS